LASQAAFGDDMQSYQAARGIEDNRRHHSNSSYTVLKTQHFPEIRALSRSGSRTRPWLYPSVAHCGAVLGLCCRSSPPRHDLAQENPCMSMEAHLAELERRHRALEAEIVEARAHPSIDDLQIVELKRRKLLVKDEIARLQN
jgi:hypothetical protein